jgi:hypothetical protein
MKGVAREYDAIRDAVAQCMGDLSVMAKTLGCTPEQARQYLYRYPALNDVYKAQRRDIKASKTPIVEAVEEIAEETSVLTEAQKRVIDDIDSELVNGWANVERVPTAMLFKLEEWGLIVLNRLETTWYAKLTDEGEIALLTGEFKEKASEPQALKQKAKPATPETPKKKGGWKKPPKQSPATNGNGAEHEISDLIGQEEAPNPFEQFREAWLEPDPLPHAEDLPVSELDCGDCDGCLHREAMALIMRKVPAAKEIYEHLAAKKTAENKIDAALKKLGG